MERKPYKLLVGSHKGGTGQTTGALALAWTLARQGWQVVLWDADPLHAASLIAVGPTGACPWKNVRLVNFPPSELAQVPVDCDLLVVDGPALTEPAAQAVLSAVDGVVLTCLADPLSLRTVPAAAKAIRQAKQVNPQLELLGLLISAYAADDPVQKQMLELLQNQYKNLLLQPPVPFQSTLCEWALRPGAPLPIGPASEAFAAIAQRLSRLVLRTARTP